MFGTAFAAPGMAAGVRERVMPLVLAALAWIVMSIEPFGVGVFRDDGISPMRERWPRRPSA